MIQQKNLKLHLKDLPGEDQQGEQKLHQHLGQPLLLKKLQKRQVEQHLIKMLKDKPQVMLLQLLQGQEKNVENKIF
jgi:hypothetical protein